LINNDLQDSLPVTQVFPLAWNKDQNATTSLITIRVTPSFQTHFNDGPEHKKTTEPNSQRTVNDQKLLVQTTTKYYKNYEQQQQLYGG